jgi:hypothetical protein
MNCQTGPYWNLNLLMKIKTALKEERGENMNARDDFRQDLMSSVNIVRVGDVLHCINTNEE